MVVLPNEQTEDHKQLPCICQLLILLLFGFFFYSIVLLPELKTQNSELVYFHIINSKSE